MGRHPDSATRLAPAVTEEVIVVGLDKNVEKRGKNVAEWGLDGFRILENAGKAGMHWVRLPERGYASADRTLTGAIPVGGTYIHSALSAGASKQFSVRSVIPKGTPAGTYHLLAAVTDAAGTTTPIAAEDTTFVVNGSGKVVPAGPVNPAATRGSGALTRLGRVAGGAT